MGWVETVGVLESVRIVFRLARVLPFGFANFFSVNSDVAGSVDTDANPISVDCCDCNRDVFPDQD